MADNSDFKEVFSWGYLFAILIALVAFSLLPTLAGWFTFWF